MCNAAIRFNPYEGFYPVQRTLQMVQQFKDSYVECYQSQPYMLGQAANFPQGVGSFSPTRIKGPTSIGNELFDEYPGATRPINTAMFAPGILYNTIKAGLAVDYPVVSDIRKPLYGFTGISDREKLYSNETVPVNQRNSVGNNIYNRMVFCSISSSERANTEGANPWFLQNPEAPGSIYSDNSFFDKRIPFEAIINPERYLTNVDMITLESELYLNNALGDLGSGYPQGIEFLNTFVNKPSNNIYKLMSRNFFGAVADFFLEDNDFTSLKSETFAGTRTFRSGEEYMARVKVYSSFSGSRDYQHEYYSSVGTDEVDYQKKNIWTQNGPRAIRGTSAYVNSPYDDYDLAVYNPIQITGNAWYPIPQHPRNKLVDAGGYNNSFQENFTMYSRTDAFGPPLAGTFCPPGLNIEKSFPEDTSLAAAQTAYFNTIQAGYAGWTYFTGYTDGTASSDLASYKPSDWDVTLGNAYPNVQALPIRDSLTGYNWAYTPPYYDGEAWVDLIFRPTAGTNYSLQDILNEIITIPRRVDPGPIPTNNTPSIYKSPEFVFGNAASLGAKLDNWYYPSSPYDGRWVNKTAMQASASLNLFGIEEIQFSQDASDGSYSNRNEAVGQRWVIKTKFETPHMNFSDIGTRPLTRFGGESNITKPSSYGAPSVPLGMWHQFGIIDPDPDKGIFLQIDDIEENWLKYHYDVTVHPTAYNNNNNSAANTQNLYKRVKSLTDLCGFDKTSQKKRLGQLKESLTVKEAVVAVPYIITSNNPIGSKSRTYFEGKKFIEISKPRFEAVRDALNDTTMGTSLDAAGVSIRQQLQKMKDYIMPPQFDFVNNDKITPVAMYLFEFTYNFDKDDLSYIWQNLAPRNYKKVFMQSDSVAHKLIPTELLTEKNLSENENLRWMVFKVKQKTQSNYHDHVDSQVNDASSAPFFKSTPSHKDEYLQYNWPYDYMSFVELIKMDVELKFGDRETTTIGDGTMQIGTTPQIIPGAAANLAIPTSPLSPPSSTQQFSPQPNTGETQVLGAANLQTLTPLNLSAVQESNTASGIIGAGAPKRRKRKITNDSKKKKTRYRKRKK